MYFFYYGNADGHANSQETCWLSFPEFMVKVAVTGRDTVCPVPCRLFGGAVSSIGGTIPFQNPVPAVRTVPRVVMGRAGTRVRVIRIMMIILT